METKVYEQKLLEKKEILLNRIRRLDRDRTMTDGPLEADIDDQSISLQNNEVEDFLSDLELKELNLVNKALSRVKEGTYAKCSVCNDPISEKRLKALPYATLCIRCMNE